MTLERLSSLDASFLYLERPAMHMHVAGLSVFAPRVDGPLSYEDVLRVVQARLHLAPRLRQRVLRVPFGLARPLWADDDHFDLDFHLRRAAIPSPGGRLQLERHVGRILSRPLDPSKPLWELYVFEGLDEERTAVLLKLHHAMADGISGMLVASILFDLQPDAAVGTPPKTALDPEPAPSTVDLIRDATQDSSCTTCRRSAGRRRRRRARDDVAEVVSGISHLVGMGGPPRPVRREDRTRAPLRARRRCRSNACVPSVPRARRHDQRRRADRGGGGAA